MMRRISLLLIGSLKLCLLPINRILKNHWLSSFKKYKSMNGQCIKRPKRLQRKKSWPEITLRKEWALIRMLYCSCTEDNKKSVKILLTCSTIWETNWLTIKICCFWDAMSPQIKFKNTWSLLLKRRQRSYSTETEWKTDPFIFQLIKYLKPQSSSSLWKILHLIGMMNGLSCDIVYS